MIDAHPHPKDIITEIKHTTSDRKIQMSLTWYGLAYQVKAITNTTWYKPGMWLSPEVVEKCCELSNWEVTMIDNDLLKDLLGFGARAIPGIGAATAI